MLIWPLVGAAVAFAGVDTVQLRRWQERARASYRMHPDSGRWYAQQILAACQEEDHPPFHAEALNMLGIVAMMYGDMDSAVHYYRQAIDYARAHQLERTERRTRFNLGIAYYNQGDFERAVETFTRALEEFASVGDSLGMGHAAFHLGNCMGRLDQHDDALRYYRRAARLYSAVDQPHDLVAVWNAMGAIFDMQRQDDSAVHYYKRSIDLQKRLNFSAIDAQYVNLGGFFMDRGHTDSALHYTRLAYRNALADRDYRTASAAALNLAQLFAEQAAHPDSALYYARQVLHFDTLTHDAYYRYLAYQLLATAFAHLQRYDSAYAYHQRYAHLKDSVEGLEIQQRIAQLEKQYQAAEKERALLEKEQRIQAQQATIRLQVMGLVALALGLVISLLWYLNRRKQHQLRMHRALTDERLRIARNLHDHAAAELTMAIADLDVEAAQSSASAGALHRIADHLRGVIETLRETVWSLRHESLSIAELLQRLEHRFRPRFERQGTSLRITPNPPHLRLNPHQALQLYAILKEALTNAFKHADASEVTVDVRTDRRTLTIEVRDNGRGFDPNTPSSGFGLQSMRERVQALGGVLNIQSIAGRGTTLSMTIPHSAR